MWSWTTLTTTVQVGRVDNRIPIVGLATLDERGPAIRFAIATSEQVVSVATGDANGDGNRDIALVGYRIRERNQ